MIRNLPKEWEIEELASVTDKIRDGNYGPDYPSREEFLTDGIPFLTSTVIANNNRIDFSKIKFISQEKHNQLTKVRLMAGDILFTNRGANVGAVAVVPKELNDGNIGPQLTQLRAKPNRLDNIYLFCYLQSWYFKKELGRLDSGSAMNFFGTATTGKFRIIVPPLPEQRKIAEILSTWDEAIAKTERMIAALQQRKKGLMQRLLIGQVRFPGFDEEWQEVKLGEIANVIMGQSPGSYAYNKSGVGLPLIQGNADIANRKTAPKVYTSEITKQCNIGDIILTVRAPVGETALSLHQACIGRGVCAIRATKCNSYFLYHLLVSCEQRWQTYAQGSTFTAINGTDIRQFALLIPPATKEQEIIAKVFNSCDGEIDLHIKKLEALKQQKKGLMQRLLTGEIRVQV